MDIPRWVGPWVGKITNSNWYWKWALKFLSKILYRTK